MVNLNLEQIHSKIVEAYYAASLDEVNKDLGDFRVYCETIANLVSLINFPAGKEMHDIINMTFYEYERALNSYRPVRREVQDVIQEQADLMNFYAYTNRTTRKILIDIIGRILTEEEIIRT